MRSRNRGCAQAGASPSRKDRPASTHCHFEEGEEKNLGMARPRSVPSGGWSDQWTGTGDCSAASGRAEKFYILLVLQCFLLFLGLLAETVDAPRDWSGMVAEKGTGRKIEHTGACGSKPKNGRHRFLRQSELWLEMGNRGRDSSSMALLGMTIKWGGGMPIDWRGEMPLGQFLE